MRRGYTIDKSVGCVIVNRNWNKVLIIRTDKHYGFPKGHMESGENEIETMRREVHEEIGIQLKHEKILGRFEIKFPIYDKNIQRVIVCYMLRYDENIELKLDPNEIDEAKWVTWKEAKELLVNSKQYLILIEAIKMIISYKFNLRNIFSKIKFFDKIILEFTDSKYHDNYIDQYFPILNNSLYYYIGYDKLIDMFINNENLNDIQIYKIKPIYRIYYTDIVKKYNSDYVISNFNGLEYKNIYNNLNYSFGIIWNIDNIIKIKI
jgi:8-oxo-dGTP pyrophosphatase MutT (NUDIX family)